MTITGEALSRELNGEKCFEMELTAPPKKQILSSKSFGKDIYDLPTIQESVAEFAGVCARKLRKQNSCAASVSVFLLSNPHKKNRGVHNASLEIKLPVPTDSSMEIVKSDACSGIVQARNTLQKGGCTDNEDNQQRCCPGQYVLSFRSGKTRQPNGGFR